MHSSWLFALRTFTERHTAAAHDSPHQRQPVPERPRPRPRLSQPPSARLNSADVSVLVVELKLLTEFSEQFRGVPLWLAAATHCFFFFYHIHDCSIFLITSGDVCGTGIKRRNPTDAVKAHNIKLPPLSAAAQRTTLRLVMTQADVANTFLAWLKLISLYFYLLFMRVVHRLMASTCSAGEK